MSQRNLHFERVLEYHENGKINDDILRAFYDRLPSLEKAIAEVEQASGLRYPPIIFDPVLTVVTYPSAAFQSTVIYASTRISQLRDRYRLCVVLSLPFLLYANYGLLKASLAHELLHYIYMTTVLESKAYMDLTGDADAPEVLAAFDETHVSDPEEWFSDPEVIRLVRQTFNPIVADAELEGAVRGGWIEKGLPVRNSSGEESRVSIPVLEISKVELDPSILERSRGRGRSRGSRPSQQGRGQPSQ